MFRDALYASAAKPQARIKQQQQEAALAPPPPLPPAQGPRWLEAEEDRSRV